MYNDDIGGNRAMEKFIAGVWHAAQPRGCTVTSINIKMYEMDLVSLNKNGRFIFGGYSPGTGKITGEFGHLLTGTVTNDLFRRYLMTVNGDIYPKDKQPGYLEPEELDIVEEVCGKWN